MVSIPQANALLGMLRGESRPSESLVKTMQLAAAPNFELQFHNTQDKVLANLNKEIESIEKRVNTNSATALLKVQMKRIEAEKAQIDAYKERTDTKSRKIDAATAYVTELLALADPSTVEEFDTKLALLHRTLETTPSPSFERYGVGDRLRRTKFEYLARIEAHTHNNFATQQDIDDTIALLNELQGKLDVSKPIVSINAEMAFKMQNRAQTKILDLRSSITEIETAAQRAATAEIARKQEYYSQVLTIFSLAFDASQEFTSFIADQVNFTNKKPAPGSVLNLFS